MAVYWLEATQVYFLSVLELRNQIWDFRNWNQGIDRPAPSEISHPIFKNKGSPPVGHDLIGDCIPDIYMMINNSSNFTVMK